MVEALMIGEVQLHTEGKHHLPIIVLGAGSLRYTVVLKS